MSVFHASTKTQTHLFDTLMRRAMKTGENVGLYSEKVINLIQYIQNFIAGIFEGK